MLKSVVGYGMRSYEKAVLKATWNDDSTSSEEHVEALIEYSNRPVKHDIALSIQSRINLKSPWKVVLKSITLIHRLLRDADESFTKDVLHANMILAVEDYLDQSTPVAAGESEFIVHYAYYVSHKLHTYNELGYWIERKFRDCSSPIEWVSSLPMQELERVFPLVMSSFDRLTSCHPSDQFDGVHPIEQKSHLLLFKDALRFYSFLTISIFQMIDQVNSFDTTTCEWMITQIAHFTKLNAKYKSWASKLCKLEIVDQSFLPNFETIPSGTIANLQTLLVGRSRNASKNKARSRSRTPKGNKPKSPSKASHTSTVEENGISEGKAGSDLDLCFPVPTSNSTDIDFLGISNLSIGAKRGKSEDFDFNGTNYE
uniref:ENTH domain-containing protein n=1 Tax=Spongospora subterranea TaxID=70186 RepID=A0A0H5R799_9EUKA|eukprot:CRZ10025.1 hypothetical protein [Spongospora subterranea]